MAHAQPTILYGVGTTKLTTWCPGPIQTFIPLLTIWRKNNQWMKSKCYNLVTATNRNTERENTDWSTNASPAWKKDFRQEKQNISLCWCCFQPNQIGRLNFKCNIIVTITTVVEAPDKGSNFDFKFKKKNKYSASNPTLGYSLELQQWSKLQIKGVILISNLKKKKNILPRTLRWGTH